MAVKLVECPRDAMQGFHRFIHTTDKIAYLDMLLKVGFDTLDCGSFVSDKAVPQMADTPEVLKALNKTSSSKLLVIIANERGAAEAVKFENVDILGFPFSISEQFQVRNARQTKAQAWEVLKNIQKTGAESGKQLQVYLSMAFGNPYDDEWSVQLAIEWCQKLAEQGVKMINISDTIGVAKPGDIKEIFSACIREIKGVEFGCHFHTRPDNYLNNISAAYEAGCRKFDSAIQGFGGCPFASDKLTGNLPTENLLEYLSGKGEETKIDKPFFDRAFKMATEIFA